jgi:hypothetical protein
MRTSAAVRATPFAPYHWLMYGRSMWFDLDHAREALDWAPRWSNDEMLAESYDWFVAHRDTAGAGSSAHRRPARAGALSILKRVSRILPLAT